MTIFAVLFSITILSLEHICSAFFHHNTISFRSTVENLVKCLIFHHYINAKWNYFYTNCASFVNEWDGWPHMLRKPILVTFHNSNINWQFWEKGISAHSWQSQFKKAQTRIALLNFIQNLIFVKNWLIHKCSQNQP